jgi:glycosyltransferase involved in cell wall biosynthesis
MKIYIISKEIGGEAIFFERISKYLNADLISFVDENKNILEPNTISGRIFYISYKFLKKIFKNRDILDSFFRQFYSYFYKLSNDLNVFSTGFAIPSKGKKIIFFQTPARFYTIDYEKRIENYKNNKLKLILFKVVKQIYDKFYKKSLKGSMIYISISNVVRNRLIKYYGIDSYVLYPSINVYSYYNSGFENYFLYVSRLHKAKRQDLAIKAFEILYQKNKNFRLVLAFPMPKDSESIDYLNSIKMYIEEKNLPVEFRIGLKNEEIVQLYAGCYTCLFCARDEDFGSVPLECMASYKPIISVNEGGPRETILDNITGFLVNDEKEMAEKMELLANDLDLTKHMGEAGRKRVEENFDDKIFVERFKKILKEKLNIEL